MHRFRLAPLALLLLIPTAGRAQEMPEMPQPTAQHEWLRQLVGEWDSTVTMFMPGQDPLESKGTVSVRPLGGFWVLCQHSGEFMGSPFEGMQTLGFDADQQQYVGTWVDSVSGYLWKYHGQVNDKRDTLTLLTKGHCPMQPGQLSDFKEVLQIKSPDHYVFTSSVKNEQGEWVTGMRIENKRK